MAGRNQVTADLRISANAELQNSRAFINKLDKIIDGFDFGDKMNKQLLSAQDQLKNLNKVLEKVQNKSVISDNELKELVKAGKEISNIVNKTEKLYSNFNDSDWKRYSKEYIAQIEKQEKEVARIKEKYAKETGGNFDKDFANLDKYIKKTEEASKQIELLNKSKDDRIKQKIEAENKVLQEQFEILQKVKSVENERKNKRNDIINNYNKNNDLQISTTGKIKTDEASVRREVANSEYQKMLTTYNEVSRKKEEILNSGKTEKQIQKELIALAKQYSLQNVKNTQQFEKQYKLLQEQKNFYNLLKNRDQLANEQAVTEEIKKRLALIQELADADKNIFIQNDFSNEKELKNKKRIAENTLDSTNVKVTANGASLTQSGEDSIANGIIAATNKQTQDLNNELSATRNVIEQINQYTAKLATQSERDNDKQDIVDMENNIKDDLSTTKEDIKNHTTYSDENVTNVISPVANNQDFSALSKDYISDVDYDVGKISEEYSNFINNVNKALKDLSLGLTDSKDIEKMIAEEEKTINAIIHEISEGMDTAIRENIEQSIEVQTRKIPETMKNKQLKTIEESTSKVLSDNTRLINFKENFSKDIEDIKRSVVVSKDNNFKLYAEDMDTLAGNIAKSAEQSQFLGSTFDDLKNKVGYFLSLNYVFDQVTRKISEAVAVTKEMDKDMTQIGLVLGKTSGQVWKNFDSYSKFANRLNTTTSEVTQSMKLFYQQGLNTAEVNKMVEASAIAAALGESTMAEASETLTSIINSYNLSANDALTVTDKISQIAIVSAADFGELSTAIEKVASSAASAGLDLDHMMGYLAKMIETTREAPTNIGTALKTIVANFTQFKEDPSGLTEEGSEINKVDKALKSVGISLTNTNGGVRDLSEVLDELGGKWNSLNRNQRAYLATQIAGNRQQSRFYALMNDYDRTLELVAEGSNSAGKAYSQFGLYTESLEASTKRLNNEWEKFFNSITSGNGVIKGFVDVLTFLMKRVNNIGFLPTVLGIGVLFKQLRKSTSELDNFKTNLDKLNESKKGEGIISSFNQKINALKKTNLSDKDRKQEYEKIKTKSANDLKKEGLSSDLLNFSKSAEKIKSYQKNIEDANTTIKTATTLSGKLGGIGKKTWNNIKVGAETAKLGIQSFAKATSTAMISMVAMWAVTKVIEVIAMAWDAATTSAEEYRERAEKAGENASTIKGLKTEYEELSKKVNKTAEEQKRLKEITEEVTKTDKQLGNQLKKNGNLYQQNVKLMDDYIDRQEKIQATDAALAIKKDNNLWSQLMDNSIIGEGFWSPIKAFFSRDNTEENMLKDQRFNDYRNLSDANFVTSGLDKRLSTLLNDFTENYIDTKGKNYNSAQVKIFADKFDKANKEFINELQKMNETQINAYEQLMAEYENGNITEDEFSTRLIKIGLSPKVWSQIYSGTISSFQDEVFTQLKNNKFLKNTGLVSEAYGNSLELDFSTLRQLFNTDTSGYTEEEKNALEEAIAKILTSEYKENGKNTSAALAYQKALQKGTDGINNYADKMKKLGVLTEAQSSALKVLKNKIYSLSSLLDSLEKYQGYISNEWRDGTKSQLDAIQEMLNGNITIKDLEVTPYQSYDYLGNSSTLNLITVNINSILEKINSYVAQLVAPIKNTETTLKGLLENAKEDRYSNNNKTDTRDIRNNAGNLKEKYEKQQNDLKNQRAALTQVKAQNNPYMTLYPGEHLEGNPITGYKMVTNPTKNNSTELSDYVKQLINEATNAIKSKLMGPPAPTENTSNSPYPYRQQGVIDLGKDAQIIEATLKNTKKEIKQTETEIKSNVYKIFLQDGIKAAEKYAASFGEIGKEALEYAKNNEKVIASLQEEIKVAERTRKTIESIYKSNTTPLEKYTAVFNQLNLSGAVANNVESLGKAFNIASNAAENNHQNVSALVKEYPMLIEAVDATSEGWKFNTQKIQENAKTQIKAEIESIDSKIRGTQAILNSLGVEQEGYTTWEDATTSDIASAMAYQESLGENSQNEANTVSNSLSNETSSYAEWGNSVIDTYRKVTEARNQYLQSLTSEEQFNFTVESNLQGKNLKGKNTEGNNNDSDEGLTEEEIKAKKDKLKTKLTDSAKKDGNNKLKERYQNQLNLLISQRGEAQKRLNNIGAWLKELGGGSKDGGSKDSFKEMEEKLDHFYNYLRKIEKLEAKINRLREERNLIDTSKNYYIDNLIKENELLAEQQELYSKYIADEGDYLNELRGELTKKFSKWVTFDSEGVVQVKQTEFSINSEKQQEEYENFSELLELYQDEYNTREENITKLTEAQIQQVENIAAAYEKVLERVTDVNDAIQKSINLLEHDVTMSFSNIAKFDIFDEQAEKAVKGIREMFGFVNEYQAQIDKINKQISEGALKEFFRWDEDLGYYRSNDLLLEDKDMQKKYEKMGYSWSEIHTYVKQTAKASEQLKQSWEESTDKANSFAETLKSLLENSISTFTNLVSSSGDELNKIFDTFDRKMNNIDNESNLFGVASENLEDKYVTLVTATATLKQTIGLLNDKRVAILDTIKEQYSEFVDEINGYTVINKQAIEESDKLTDGQKAQLLSWYEAFNAYDELVEASEDRLVDYFNQILEMENKKRDAIINLKQSVHDELIARDQEEIDDLREKYDKMSQLDNEYYNKLADKVNRARQLREDRQADSAIPQTQAQIAVLKTDNSGTRNSEILNLQKQLNEQLQSQADRDVDRELERIQREQQEREEDRQLTIAAMENVLTFKDENNWYWQEAQRIWAEGPESVTGFLRTSNEYMNISDEQRAQLFEELSNSVNTAFTTLQTAAGITSAISDGIVKDKSDEEQAKLDNVNNNLGFIQSQLGQEGLAGKIDWANAENAKHLLEIQTNAEGNALKITAKLEDLYKEKIGPTAENLQNTVVQYLGKESDIWRKLGMLDATTGQVNTSVESGFTQLTDAVNKAITWISSDMDKAWSEYKTKAIEVFNYLSKEYGKQNAQTPDKNDVKLPDVKKEPTKNEPPKPTTPVKTDNSSGGTSKKTLKVGGGATAKTGAKIYSSYAGGSGAGQYYSKDPNYKVLQLRGNRALVRWHKLSSGYTGWFNKTDLTPYRKGGYVNYTGIAAVHGSKTSPEAFLSAKQTKLFEVLRDSLVATTNKGYTKEKKEATNTGYNIDNINIEVKELADVDSVEKMTRKVKEEIYKDATGRNNMAVRRR